MDIVIRRATEDDVDAIRFVGFSTWPPTYGPVAGASYVVRGLDAYWSAAVLGPAVEAGDVLVAEADGRVIGVSQAEADGDRLVMWKLYVLPAEQGSGAGRALLEAVRGRADVEGLALWTEYVAGNERAGAFYRSQGFIAETTPSSAIDAVWMRYVFRP